MNIKLPKNQYICVCVCVCVRACVRVRARARARACVCVIYLCLSDVSYIIVLLKLVNLLVN